MHTDIARRAESYLARALDLEGFRVVSAEPISGAGLSRQVVKLVTTLAEQPGEVPYILLLEQDGSPVKPNRVAEFSILRALRASPDITVATAYCMEQDAQYLGAPFLLTGFLPGFAKPQMLLEPDLRPFGRHIIEASFVTLGRLAALDTASLGLEQSMAAPHPDEAWRTELERWEKMLFDAGGNSLVVTNAALRRLHRWHPPAPDRLSIIHGDYRVGNYLFDTAGLTGVIDWEMVHLGDALEDLAWSLLPNWEFAALPGQVGGFLSREEAVAAWESTSHRAADPAALAWWSLFCHVKAVAIWATARHLISTGRDKTMLMALVGYGLVEKQESSMIDLLRAPAP